MSFDRSTPAFSEEFKARLPGGIGCERVETFSSRFAEEIAERSRREGRMAVWKEVAEIYLTRQSTGNFPWDDPKEMEQSGGFSSSFKVSSPRETQPGE